MKPKLYYSVALLLTVSFFAGCDSSSLQELPSKVTKAFFEESPSEVVKAFYKACNEGKYSVVESYFSSHLKRRLERSAMVGLKSGCDRATRNGTVARVEITNEQIRGEGAAIRLVIHFKDGSSKEDNETLIKEGGSWKLTVS